MPQPSLDALFLEHVGPSLAKHLALLRAVEGLPCHADLKRGEVRFGRRFTFPLQLLGLEDHEAQSWTWSWGLPDGIVARPFIQAALDLQAWGKARNLDLFFTPKLRLHDFTGDQIAILACGLAQSPAFLIMDIPVGTAFFLLTDLRGRVPTRHAAAFLQEVFREMLTAYTLPDHRAAARSLLRFEGYDLDETRPDTWHARRADGSRITVGFDPQGRLAELQAKTGGAA